MTARIPCGKTLGHGEGSCSENQLCDNCEEILRLREELAAAERKRENPDPPAVRELTPAEAARERQEREWYENLPSSMQRIVDAQGADLFHFTLNRAMLEEEVNRMMQQIHSRDAQMRLHRIGIAVNVLITLLMKFSGWTGEQHAACRREIDLALDLGAGSEKPQIIIPAHLKH